MNSNFLKRLLIIRRKTIIIRRNISCLYCTRNSRISVCVYACVYVCMCVCMCVYVCVYVCISASMYVCMYVDDFDDNDDYRSGNRRARLGRCVAQWVYGRFPSVSQWVDSIQNTTDAHSC